MNHFLVERLREKLEPIATPRGPKSEVVCQAAVVLILNSLEEQLSLLLVRRAVRQDDPWSGQTAFPGGHTNSQDASLLDTVIRETQEEVGVNLLDHDLLGRMSDVYSARRPVVVTPFVASLRTEVTLALRRDELSDVTWIPVRDLARSQIVKQHIRTSEHEMEADGIAYRDQFIWGLTLRMINDLLARLGNAYERVSGV